MARQAANSSKQKAYWGQGLAAAGVMVLLVDVFTLARPLWEMAEQLRQGRLDGVILAAGMSLLNATNALAFHRVDYFWLASHLLVLSCAVTALLTGIVLLRPRAKRTFVFEMALAPKFEDRETINNGSR